ncbi:MAG: hypothetical protein ACXQTR_01770 [Candidatus Methanospirareceae archaeon]
MISFTIRADLITLPNEYTKKLAELGEWVTLSEVQDPGTERQNRAFHSLIGEWWVTGCMGYPTYETMRDSYMLRVKGAKEYKLFTSDGILTVKDITPYEPCSAVPIPYSWTRFTKKERMEAIKQVLADIYQSGATSKKLDEIIGGLEHE